MSKNWRPENWKNPFVNPIYYDLLMTKETLEDFKQTFEAGADAMLKALREDGGHRVLPQDNEIPVKLNQLFPKVGWVVFIPDDSE